MIQERFKLWSTNEYFDKETRSELLSLNNQQEIEERFYTELEFGTGGMRGILGAGTNRMNRYVIRKITQGIADSIRGYGEKACKMGVVIAYDSRRKSEEFALETGLVLAANGIKAFLFDRLRPTPELSFAVRYFKAIAGVMITASHNPKEYNGYKVYWEDGGQIPPDKADVIVKSIAAREDWLGIIPMNIEEAKRTGLLEIIGEKVDQVYLDEVKKQLLFPELIKSKGGKVKIVYTPLHGTGNVPITKIMNDVGFTSFFVVPEQKLPDTEFSTVRVPNPEDAAAFELALKYGKELEADILLATDPDADRLGMYLKNKDGDYVCFTGNQIGVILEYYLLSQRKKMGKLPDNAVVVKTVATSDLGDAVADEFGVKTVNVLVGFKFIGEKIKEMEEEGWGTYQFGFEESYGYLAGTHARDKDAVVAAVLLTEAVLYYKEIEKKTLLDVLDEIYIKHGYYLDEQKSVTFKGKEGKNRIALIMERLRSAEKIEIAGIPVARIDDYQSCKGKILKDQSECLLNLPHSNVLRFSFEGGGFAMARPSGTEPKIKFYFSVKSDSPEKLQSTMENVKEDFLALVKDLIE
ncbi:MAG: phospho-sugar mutase [Eubacteriales bacterium]